MHSTTVNNYFSVPLFSTMYRTKTSYKKLLTEIVHQLTRYCHCGRLLLVEKPLYLLKDCKLEKKSIVDLNKYNFMYTYESQHSFISANEIHLL